MIFVGTLAVESTGRVLLGARHSRTETRRIKSWNFYFFVATRGDFAKQRNVAAFEINVEFDTFTHLYF